MSREPTMWNRLTLQHRVQATLLRIPARQTPSPRQTPPLEAPAWWQAMECTALHNLSSHSRGGACSDCQ